MVCKSTKSVNDPASSHHPHANAYIPPRLQANAGPNTNGSQFFITLRPCPELDGRHTIFGRISSGMSIIQKLGLVRTDDSDR